MTPADEPAPGAALLGDRPIALPQDDAFGLSPFADALATSLLRMSPADGLVLSVEAPWGAGKSSAIALTLRAVKQRVLIDLGQAREAVEALAPAELDARWAAVEGRRVHLVAFNPWMFSGQENLVRAFFKEVAAQIDFEPDGAVRKALNRLAGYLPAVGGVTAGAGAFLGSAFPVAGAAATVGRAAGEAAERALRSEASLDGARVALAAALREAGERVIVVIDDIDRLLPGETRAVLSLVKSLGDLPNVLYVLAFDEAVVRRALAEGPERLDPAFLEKIVQVSLKLPPPWREELRALLFRQLNVLVEDDAPADEERWARAVAEVIDPYVETPRDVARLVNTLKVIWPNVRGDIDLTDLVVLTVLQLFDTEVYALVRDEIEVITYADYRYEDKKELGARLSPTNARLPDAAKNAMALLFPRLAEAWNNFNSDGTSYITRREQRRISTKEYYRNYFMFGRDARRLSRAEIDGIVTAQDPARALTATLARLAADAASRPRRAAAMLGQFGQAVYAKPLLTPALLRALLDESDGLIAFEDIEHDLFPTDNEDRLHSLIRLGLDKLDASKREDVLDVLVSHPAGLQLRARAVEGDARRHGLFGEEAKHESEQFFPGEKVEAAALALRDQIAAAAEAGTIWASPSPATLIWSWWRMGGGERLDAWLKGVMRDDEAVVRLARCIPNARGGRAIKTFRRGAWETILDYGEVVRRLESLGARPGAAEALRELLEAERAGRE